MKRKSLLVATAAAAILGAATLSLGSSAQAHPTGGWGMMGGYGPGYGHMGYGGGWGYMGPAMMGGYGPGWMHGYGPGYRQGPRGPGYRGGYGPGYGPGWCFGAGGWR